MSKENVKKFYDALAQDAAFAEELDARIAATTIEFAAEKGFEFTAEEAAAATQELTCEDLDNVNGGFSRGFYYYSEAKRKEEAERAKGIGATPNGRGASGGW